MNKKLYRSKDNKVIAGILGGIGEYFDADPVIIRLAWILILVFTAFIPGIIAYILAMIVMPIRPYGEKNTEEHCCSKEEK